MGIVANGHIYRGAHGGGGELGHVVIDPDGPLCNCGNRGCLETFVADPWLLRRANLNGLNVTTPDELLAAAQADHPVGRDVLEKAGCLLGQTMANLVNLFNPELIIVSGEGVRMGEFIFKPMREAMQRHMFAQLADGLELRIEPVSDDAWARGAASLVLNKIFSIPELQ
jgi:N-acetylglucosamine repressor